MFAAIHLGFSMLTKQFFKNKRVTVFGLGLNGGGVSTVKFLSACGAKEIIVTDIKQRSELKPSLDLLKSAKNVTYVLGQHRPEDFIRTDMVIVNPGIAWSNEYVKIALKHNVPVEMDASLFFQICKNPIIGVTGTKGKTTTASLIAHILETAGHHVVRAGISQKPVLDTLDEIKSRSVVVFELSSWRLSSLRRIQKSPHIAVFTNIFPDHLNYYESMAAYIRDKKYIFEFQTKKDWLIYNQDDEKVKQLAEESKACRMAFSHNTPETSQGVRIQDDAIVLVSETGETPLMPLSELRLKGSHNHSNVLAATAAVLAFGVDVKALRKALRSFTGVPHRLELVREKDGVAYYNDTAATMPDAALSSLRAFDRPIVLIAGGNNKGLSFTVFGEVIASTVKDVVFLKGNATEAILRILRKNWPDRDVLVVDSMERAVQEARARAVSGDIVLLSPGAASFGLFKNEFDRGEQFRTAVKAL